MRILIVSDLHANWPALEATLEAEPFDRLMVGDDLVSYGPHPREVIDLVRSRATAVVRGNHDNALTHRVDCRCSPSNQPLAEATRALHRGQLSSDDVEFLGGLPLTASVEAAGTTFYSVHASPRDPLFSYAIKPDATEELLEAEVAGVDADYVLLGHTHLPMLRRIGTTTVINPGSVGQPRDGDPRASYAVIEDGVPQLKRIAYDVERTIRDLRQLPIEPSIIESLVTILRSGRT